MQLAFERVSRMLIHEAFVHRRVVVGLFVTINLLMLALGLAWPQGYSAFTTILVDEKNIIQPLMQGAAVTTEVGDRAKMAREVIFGRKIMDEILQYSGWMKDNPSAAEQEKLIKKKLIARTSINNLGKNLIKIEYKDEDPERAFKTTKRMAELFISESLEAKAQESQAAYDFINKQAEEYHEKLTNAESQLKEFRSANLDARPGTEAEVGTRINTLQAKIEQTTEELKEAEIRKSSLEKQLSGEAELSSAFSREGQYRTRIAELQSQIDTLRLNYQDTYPDIVRLKHQIQDLNESIEAEQRDRRSGRSRPMIDESVTMNPLYQQLRRDLSQAMTSIDTLKARLSENRHLLQQELDRGRRVHGGEATIAELTRDYEVNRDIYQDLLKRRENARVSMNLDLQKQGLSFRISEPASLPHQPSGLRFLHFAIGGLVLGILGPMGFLFVIYRVDPRVRFDAIISDRLKLPVLAIVPHLHNPAEIQGISRSLGHIVIVILANIAIVATIAALKMTGAI
jgi:polysaccharide chain length determinant protein (PEP-CTERM system associated)